MAERHELESEARGDLSRLALMRRIEVGMQEGDGDGGEPLSLGLSQGLRERSGVQRPNLAARGVHPLVGFHDPGVEGGGTLDPKGEEVGPRLVADHQAIGEPLGGDEQGSGAGPLQQRIGGDGGAHLDGVHPVGRKGRAGRDVQNPPHGLHGGVGIGGGGRGQLERNLCAAVRLADDVGEGAAPVDPEAPAPVQNLTCPMVVIGRPHP